jgi:hypothetical protein
MSKAAVKLISCSPDESAEEGGLYGIIGADVCMGDHKVNLKECKTSL